MLQIKKKKTDLSKISYNHAFLFVKSKSDLLKSKIKSMEINLLQLVKAKIIFINFSFIRKKKLNKYFPFHGCFSVRIILMHLLG